MSSSQTPMQEAARLLDQAEQALQASDLKNCEKIAVQIEALAQQLPDEAEVKLDLRFFLADFLFEKGETQASLERYQALREQLPDDPELEVLEARAHFHLWQFDQAQRILDAHEMVDSTRAAALYYRALLAEYRGDDAEAEKLYDQAAQADGDSYPKPIRRDPAEVERLLLDVLRSLPPEIKKIVDGISLNLQSLPDPRLHACAEVDPLVLGLYYGKNLLEEVEVVPDVDRIDIFQKNIERICDDFEELAQELRTTLLHEIGHHLGWDEAELARRGLA